MNLFSRSTFLPEYFCRCLYFHGIMEYVMIELMVKAAEVIPRIEELYT
jgi:hypothetical protein